MATERENWRAEALALQDTLADQVISTARGLTEEDWAAPTNCPPWVVRDIIEHMARSGITFRNVVDRGLSGDHTLATDPVERARVEAELKALGSAALIDKLGTAHRALRDRLAELSSDELEVLCPHSRGLQPAWWMADQRLSELAFHYWDLLYSLGREREIDAPVGQHLLPTLLERNSLTWYKPAHAQAGRWVITARDLEDGVWLIEPGADGVAMTRGPATGDITIEGTASGLIRWLYGRADLETLERQGQASISGDRTRFSGWKDMFPAP